MATALKEGLGGGASGSPGGWVGASPGGGASRDGVRVGSTYPRGECALLVCVGGSGASAMSS